MRCGHADLPIGFRLFLEDADYSVPRRRHRTFRSCGRGARFCGGRTRRPAHDLPGSGRPRAPRSCRRPGHPSVRPGRGGARRAADHAEPEVVPCGAADRGLGHGGGPRRPAPQTNLHAAPGARRGGTAGRDQNLRSFRVRAGGRRGRPGHAGVPAPRPAGRRGQGGRPGGGGDRAHPGGTGSLARPGAAGQRHRARPAGRRRPPAAATPPDRGPALRDREHPRPAGVHPGRAPAVRRRGPGRHVDLPVTDDGAVSQRPERRSDPGVRPVRGRDRERQRRPSRPGPARSLLRDEQPSGRRRREGGRPRGRCPGTGAPATAGRARRLRRAR
jgi:hypothetical protein